MRRNQARPSRSMLCFSSCFTEADWHSTRAFCSCCQSGWRRLSMHPVYRSLAQPADQWHCMHRLQLGRPCRQEVPVTWIRIRVEFRGVHQLRCVLSGAPGGCARPAQAARAWGAIPGPASLCGWAGRSEPWLATKQGVWTASRDRTLKLWTPADARLLVPSTTPWVGGVRRRSPRQLEASPAAE